MSKIIKTIQSSEKDIFDRLVNIYLSHGCDLHETGYSILENGIYSQVLVLDEKKFNYI